MIKVFALCMTYFLQLHTMFATATRTGSLYQTPGKICLLQPASVNSPKSVIKFTSPSALRKSWWFVYQLEWLLGDGGKPQLWPFRTQGNLHPEAVSLNQQPRFNYSSLVTSGSNYHKHAKSISWDVIFEGCLPVGQRPVLPYVNSQVLFFSSFH